MTIGLLINILLAFYAYKRWKVGDRCMYFVILQFLIFQTYKLDILLHSAIRSDDLALILVLLTAYQGNRKVRIPGLIGKSISVFICFILMGMVVSMVFKDLPLTQVIKGARPYFFVLALNDVWLMKKEELMKTIYNVFMLNIVFSVIFIIQTFLPVRLLIDTWQGEGNGSSGFLGLRRYYSFPPFVPFCCLYSCFLYPSHKKYKKVCIFISLATVLLIQSRGMLMYTALLVVMAFILFKASSSKKLLYIGISFVIGMLLDATVLSGDTGERTNNDISKIISGEVSMEEMPDGDATMSLRVYMVLKRIERIEEGDIFDRLFGLGFFAQINGAKVKELGLEKVVARYYQEDEFFMHTPDISYANIIASIGYGGSVLYVGMMLSMLCFFLKNKEEGKYAQLGILYMIYLLATGLNGSSISNPTCMLLPFLFMKIVHINTNTLVFKDRKFGNKF